IVEHTVGPVLDEKLEALRGKFRKVRKTFDREMEKATAYPVKKPSGDTWEPREFAAEKTCTSHQELVEQLFDFRTLDPAMGSGHFLVEAVDFITDRLLSFLNGFPVNPVTFMLNKTRRNIEAALGEQGVAIHPDKLTEVNLLKRHVLKRCIYGVDLNPMAVELAKVSLWLDAFTIGAPLSFLDHHLRCGNSLIGATFKDLEAVTEGQLFSIDYEPLLRAIQHVLVVNKMADATAAEVKKSASEYTQARDELSGYQIVLDLLVAKHFGFPKAPGLLTHGHDLDLSNRDRFLDSLDDDDERELVTKVEALAKQSNRRFFHWEIEFPEVFFGFQDAGQRHLKHKDDIEHGSAGFDAVIGNPPYVSVTNIPSALRPYLLDRFSTATGRFDLYIVFIEQSLTILRVRGQHAFINPVKFCIYANGRVLRELILRKFQLISLLDVSQTNDVFEDPTTYPCVPVTRHVTPDEHHAFRVARAGVGSSSAHFIDALRKHTEDWRQLTYATIRTRPENIISPTLTGRALDFVESLENRSESLGKYFRIEQCIRIGSSSLRKKVLLSRAEHDKASDAVRRRCKRVIDGEDLDRYSVDWRGTYLDYLPDELYNPKSTELLDREKILVKRVGDRLKAAFDDGEEGSCFYPLNTIYALVPEDTSAAIDPYVLLALLNSRFADWLYRVQFEAISVRGGYVEYREYLKYLPLVKPEMVIDSCDVQERKLLPGPSHVDDLRSLSKALVELHQKRRCEQVRFIETFGNSVKSDIDLTGFDFVDTLSGKTKVLGFAGDIDQGGSPVEFPDLIDVLRRNRRRINENSLNPSTIETIQRCYEEALQVLDPIHADIVAKDQKVEQCIDRLFGISDEERSMITDRK
ncbi:MAG: Eco57I restriction-modification methylase domain-containing protein, partial [Planctomycetes bacterium]|nr:Eco57I restriction-modification methylase domain-containing protein [Planctomycetota bacterium]